VSAPRKSRRRRLPISGGLGAPTEWSPTAIDWRRFEKEYGLERGQNFDDGLRREIRAAVTNYLYWEPFERHAPFADDFIENLAKAAEFASRLTDTLRALGNAICMTAPHWDRYFPPEAEETAVDAPADEGDAAFLERILNEKPRRYRRDVKETADTIRGVLEDTLAGVTRDGAPAFAEGDAWKQLIVDLARAFKARAMKVTASKDAYRAPSPFVRFVKALQSTFDKDFRRHEADSGLPLAVGQVLKPEGKTWKTGGNLSRGRRESSPKAGEKCSN
jgi:hypothetical protein